MAKFMWQVLVLAMLAIAAVSAAADDCSSDLFTMSPCLSFVMKGSNESKPDAGCCAAAKGIVSTAPECICSLLKEAIDMNLGVDVSRVLQLPETCSLNVPKLPPCDVSGVPAPATPVNPVPSTPPKSSPPPPEHKSSPPPPERKSPPPAYVSPPPPPEHKSSPPPSAHISSPPPPEQKFSPPPPEHKSFPPPPAPDCSIDVKTLMPCLEFVQKGSKLTKPNAPCCAAASNIVSKAPGCICSLLKQAIGMNLGVDVSRVLELPGTCSLKVPELPPCDVSGIPAPAVPTPPSTTSPTTPAPGISASGSAASLCGLLPFMVAVMASLVVFLF